MRPVDAVEDVGVDAAEEGKNALRQFSDNEEHSGGIKAQTPQDIGQDQNQDLVPRNQEPNQNITHQDRDDGEDALRQLRNTKATARAKVKA